MCLIPTHILEGMEKSKEMKVLLVGGFGFLGKNMIKKFSNDHELIVYTKEKTTESTKINDLQVASIEKGLIEDKKIHDVIKKYKPDVVIHLAALSGLRKCEENVFEAFQVNVFGTFNIIKACLETHSKIIFISSREVYGETLSNESTEDDPLMPNNIYGITKMIGETLVKHAGHKHNLDYTILRLSNVYGPGGQGGVNRIIKTAVEEKRIQINDGNQFMNFVYVEDVVDLIMLVLNDKHSSKQIFNVGSDDTLTINEFATKVAELVHDKIKLEYFPRIEFETICFKPSLIKLEKILKFRAKTNLKVGIEKTIKWYENER